MDFLEINRFARRLRFKVQEALTLFNKNTLFSPSHNCTIKINSTNSKRTQANAKETVKQIDRLQWNWITLKQNLAEFNYVAMFAGELTESWVAGLFRNSAPNSISRTFHNQLIEFSAIAKV